MITAIAGYLLIGLMSLVWLMIIVANATKNHEACRGEDDEDV